MHSEAKQYQNIRVWNREMFIKGPCKETGGSCHRNPRLPENSQQSPCLEKVREGVWLVVANFLVLDPLFWGSGCGRVVMFL